LGKVSWAMWLGGLISVFSIVAYVRRQRDVSPERHALRSVLRARQALLLGLALLVTIGALITARNSAQERHTPGFTALWILTPTAAEPGTVQVGLRSMELSGIQYSLQIEADGNIAYEWPVIELEPDGQWQSTISLPRTAADSTVVATLYRLDDPGVVYRRVVLQRDTQN
jgi:hypothetical protein